MMPSRDFLIRQAALNFVAATYPVLLQHRTAGSILGQITLGGQWIAGTPEIVQRIRDEFFSLADQFKELRP